MNNAASFLSVHLGSVCSKASVAVKKTISHIGKAARDIWEVASDKFGGFFAIERKEYRKRTARKSLDKAFKVQKPDVSEAFNGKTSDDFSDQKHSYSTVPESTTMESSLCLSSVEEEDFFQNVPSFVHSVFSDPEEGVHMQPNGRLSMAVLSNQGFSEFAMSEPFHRKPLEIYGEEKKDFVTSLGYFMESSYVTCAFAESLLRAQVLCPLEGIIANDSGMHLNSCLLMKNIFGNAEKWRDSDKPPTLADFAKAFFFMRYEARKHEWVWPRGSPFVAGEHTPGK